MTHFIRRQLAWPVRDNKLDRFWQPSDLSNLIEKDMSGKPITKQQVNLYMSYRQEHNQVKAAAKVGISERSARRIESGQHT